MNIRAAVAVIWMIAAVTLKWLEERRQPSKASQACDGNSSSAPVDNTHEAASSS